MTSNSGLIEDYDFDRRHLLPSGSDRLENESIGGKLKIKIGDSDTYGIVTYNPLGDRTPLREVVQLRFNVQNLHRFVTGNVLCRPRRIFDATRFVKASKSK